MPAAVIGASVGVIGTAVGQQSLRAVLSFCNARQMTSPGARPDGPAARLTVSQVVYRSGANARIRSTTSAVCPASNVGRVSSTKRCVLPG